MRKLLSIFVAVTIVLFTFVPSATAVDLGKGAKVFQANCAACHAGGRNVINSSKTLNKSDLEKYQIASLNAIKYQVKKGKMAMPAFGSRLSEAEIENVAAYVLEQAKKGW